MCDVEKAKSYRVTESKGIVGSVFYFIQSEKCEGEKMKIAIYGKGGIGKSTVASNLSIGLAAQGKRVLHVGCDPKGDSCRSIVGRPIPDFVQMFAEKGTALRPEDVIIPGNYGVRCIEVGGPKLGSGCAGMGMNAMNNMLEQYGVWEEDWDCIIYDVLGDIVCSGFSSAMRKSYTDLVYVVTSAEYMSLYAANNILRALEAIGGGKANFGGFIFNRYQEMQDKEIVEAFLQCTKGYAAGRIPFSCEIRQADYAQLPVLSILQQKEHSEVRAAFEMLIASVQEAKAFCPCPMETEAMESFRLFCIKKEEEKDGISETAKKA